MQKQSETLLSISGLDAGYDDFQALFDVGFELHRGEILALIGANGAGKSTLMRAITGLVRSKPSMIKYRGEDIGGMSPDKIAKRGIALVPEGRRLFRSLSVEENLIIGSQVNRTGAWSLKTVYELFPILHEKRHFGSTDLSGGQQQMVAIGRALMSNPDLILFDEISLGLAPIVIKDIYAALPTIVSTGVSAIVVEQDIARALRDAQKFICLQEGKVSLAGVPSEISRQDITAAYFGR